MISVWGEVINLGSFGVVALQLRQFGRGSHAAVVFKLIWKQGIAAHQSEEAGVFDQILGKGCLVVLPHLGDFLRRQEPGKTMPKLMNGCLGGIVALVEEQGGQCFSKIEG